MARTVAISIGVARVPGFPYLAGALTGVAEFARWAESQHFSEIHEITDDGRSVTFTEIYEIVASLVAGDVTRLFLYFAGHGLACGYGEDVWLLSDVRNNPNEAINADLSYRLARTCPIPHVAFFADTCRTAADASLLGITGSVLFPRCGNLRPGQVDRFFACLPGLPAWERRPDDPGTPPYGIYTKCLLPALWGQRPDAVRAVINGREPKAVLANSLAMHLERAVPIQARREAGKEQPPDSLPGSYWEPNVIAWVPADIAQEPPPSVPTGGQDPDDEPDVTISASVVSEIAANIEATGQGVSPAAAGFTLHGQIADEADDGGQSFERGEWVIGRQGDAAAAIVKLDATAREHARWAGFAIIPGHTAAIRVGERGVEYIGYMPATATYLSAKATSAAMARAAALARIWRLDRADDDILSAAYDDLNPTITVCLAYHFDRFGHEEAITRLVEDFANRGRVLPFDIALLAGREAFALARVFPAYPLMTRGWPLLANAGLGEVSDLAETVLPHLGATPWTTLVGISDHVAEAMAVPLSDRSLESPEPYSWLIPTEAADAAAPATSSPYIASANETVQARWAADLAITQSRYSR